MHTGILGTHNIETTINMFSEIIELHTIYLQSLTNKHTTTQTNTLSTYFCTKLYYSPKGE